MRIEEVVSTWDPADRRNLGAILGLPSDHGCLPEELEDRFHYLFNGFIRPGMKAATRNVANRVWKVVARKESSSITLRDTWTEFDYPGLIAHCGKHIKAYEPEDSREDNEVYLLHKLLALSLDSMPPRERRKFLETEVNCDEIASKAGIEGARFRGQLVSLAALSAAQASGFGVYLLSTTLLGMLTHAIGVTLPFAVYTGLSSAIAMATGPLGWTALGVSALWKAGGPNWKKLIPGAVYMIAVRSRPV